ncbi:MAG: PAS domain S-box protein [Nitrospira sp.]
MVPLPNTKQRVIHRDVGDVTAVQPEQLFRAIFDQAAVGLALIETATGRFVRLNQQYLDMMGFTQAEMLATTFMAITYPDDLQEDLDNMEGLKAGHLRGFSMEKRLYRRDRSILWVNLTVSPTWKPDEVPTFHLALIQDITARKEAEANVARLNATLEQQVAQRTRELEESRQQLQAILDGTSDAVFVKDLEGRYLLINKATERFVGKCQDEVIGHDDGFIFPPAEAKAVMEGDRNVMMGGGTMTYEDVATTADGVQRTFLSTKGPLVDGQGQVMGLFGISRDITKRVQAERALRESEERFRSVFEHAGIGIAITDMTGQFLRCNPAYCSLLGYSEEEFRRLVFSSLVHPDDVAVNMAEIERLISQELPWFEIENRYCHKDGHDVWVHKFVSVLRDDTGRPANLFALVTDVTERRRMQELLEQRVAERTEQLRVSEQFTREVLDSLSAHVAVLDRTGTIVDVNRVWSQSAVEQDPHGRYHIGVGANYLEVCRRAAEKSGEAQQALEGISDVLSKRREFFEAEYLCQVQNSSCWFAMRVTPLNGRDGGAVVVHEDVTQRKHAEEALRASYRRLQSLSREVQVATERERSRLSRELHDEFGQLLSALKFDLSRIAVGAGKKSAPSSTAGRKIAASAMGTVDRLFVSLHEMICALRPGLLNELGLVAAIEAMVTDMQERSGLTCQVIAEGKESRASFGAATEDVLYRVAQELLTNVVRHAHARSATIRLGCAGGWVYLTVQDDGKGFKVASIRGKGHYGLQGIQERVDLLGGSLEICSKPGNGTLVTVRIPVALPPSEQKTEEVSLRGKA